MSGLKMPSTIELWDTCGMMSLLVPCPTGIIWSNQVGGTCCLHPSIEGICIPLLPGKPSHSDPLYDRCFVGRGADQSDVAELVTAFLKKNNLHGWLEPASQEFVAQHHLHEAWVPVCVRRFDSDKSAEANEKLHGVFWLPIALQPFAGCEAIVTYQNSD